MNNFKRLLVIMRITIETDPIRRKSRYLKLLRKYILLNFVSKELIITIPKQKSSVYFRYIYGKRWKKEYADFNGVKYCNAYSHFSEEIFEEVLKMLDYSITQKEEKTDKWIYCIN